MKKIIVLLLVILAFNFLMAENQNRNSDRYLTLVSETSVPSAFRAIEILSQKETGKKIINLCSITTPIGFPINEMYWKDALYLLVKLNDLELEELPGAFKVKDKTVAVKKEDQNEVSVDSKQVKITSTFFQTSKDVNKAVGVDWSTVFNGKVNARVDFNGSQSVTNDIISATGSTTIDNGEVSIDVNTLVRILESHEVGTVIAKPNITVISGKKGYIQVGSDFSIKTLDQAGNMADKFFSTGMILSVKPIVVESDGIEAIHLDATVENSAVIPGQERTTIGKSESTTEVLLYDGETTILGGIYNTDETVIRNGVPFLKDLPWWVLGIRYLTGVNKKVTSEKETIVILKAELVKPLQERMEEIIPAKEKIKKIRNENREGLDTFDSLSFEK